MSDDEGRRLIKAMKKKFSAIISEEELNAMESDVPGVETPLKLERAILNLIANLNNPSTYEDDNISMLSDSTVEEDTRRIKSPPLSIIPPKPNTIKPSIFKATAVMGTSKSSQSPNIKEEPKSPATPNQSTSGESSLFDRVKVEPAGSMLSPTSCSRSSFDSDNSSPFLSANSTNHHKLSLLNAQPNNANFAPYENLPVYDIEAATTTANESIMMASNSVNNNNSNNNRNSVLKRAYPSDDDDYSEQAKKRSMSVQSPAQATPPSQSIDLLESSVSGSNSDSIPT